MAKQLLVQEHLDKLNQSEQPIQRKRAEQLKQPMSAVHLKMISGCRMAQGSNLMHGESKHNTGSRKASAIICGARFGHLTVIEQTEERKNRYVVWKCRCDCGNEYCAASRELRSRRAVSCKDPSCKYYIEAMRIRCRAEDITGRRFGKLIVLGPAMEEQFYSSTCKNADVHVLKVSFELAEGYEAVGMNLGNQNLHGQRKREEKVLEAKVRDASSLSGQMWNLKRVKRDDRGRFLWECKCDCGKIIETTSSELRTGNRKSCGCLSRPPLKDWIGHRFGYLTVTSYEGKRNGSHFWICRCDCGNETVVSQSSLQSGHTCSCGCFCKPPSEYKTFVDGTCVEILRSAVNQGKVPKNNTSGVRGVYRDKKRKCWCAQITFKGKTINLGSYETIGEAKFARERGVERYFREFLEEYDKRIAEEEQQAGRTSFEGQESLKEK